MSLVETLLACAAYLLIGVAAAKLALRTDSGTVRDQAGKAMMSEGAMARAAVLVSMLAWPVMLALVVQRKVVRLLTRRG